MANTNRKKTEECLSHLKCESNRVIETANSELKFGWSEISIGDKVYFGSNGPSGLEIICGVIIGIRKTDRRMWINPSVKSEKDYEIQTRIEVIIECPCGQLTIDSSMVHNNKQDAMLAAMNNILNEYFNL